MRQLGTLLSDYWWIYVLLIILGVVVALSRRRMNDGSQADGMGLEPDSVAEGGAPKATNQSGIQADFGAVLRRFVLPLHEAHPEWERLDGAVGVPGRSVARFERNGTVYSLSSESQIPALLAVRDWMEAHPGEDPLVVQPTKRGAGRLALRPEVGWPDGRAVLIETV